MQTEEKRLRNRFRSSKYLRITVKLLLFIMLSAVVAAGGIFYCIFDCAKNSEPQKSDVMIVLGCQAWGDTPSPMLEYRLEKALDLYNKGLGGYIIVSGGRGKDEKFTEAHVMKEWLQKNGVDGDKIIEEEKSTSTFENIKYSKKIIEDKKFKTAVIVSSDFHIFRSLKLAERLGVKASGAPSPTVDYLKFYYYSREILSVVKSFLLDR